MSSPRAALLAIVLLLVTFSTTCTASAGSNNQPKIVKQRNSNSRAGGCLNYGHSCLGAHGKRSGTGLASAPPQQAQQKALMEVLMAALLASATGAADHSNTEHTRVHHTDNTALPGKSYNSLSSQHRLGQHRSETSLNTPSQITSWFPINPDLLEGLGADAVSMKAEDMTAHGDDMIYAYDTDDLRDNVDDYGRSNSGTSMPTWNPRRMQALLVKQGLDLSKLGNWIRR